MTTNLKLSFSGHETFVFRYGWMKKAVDAVLLDPEIFHSDRAIVTLGVGKNMVASIRHWALVTHLLEEQPKARGNQIRCSDLGILLFGPEGRDPYLEDPNTLWILHWNILANMERCTTWVWAFNFISSNQFTRDGLAESLLEEVRKNGGSPPSENTLGRDIEVLLRTYIPRVGRAAVQEDALDCPLAELELIEEVPGIEAYKLRRGPKPTLADEVFVYALADFWERQAPAQNSLAFTEIAYRKGSPGNVFKLDDNSIVNRLERLDACTNGEMIYTETAGLKQVLRRTIRPSLDYLAHYYNQSPLPLAVEV